MRKYCEECGREVETKVIAKKEIFLVCDELIEVDAEVLVCKDCGEEFYCEELDSKTLDAAYSQYRKKHNLSLTENIRNYIKENKNSGEFHAKSY